MSTQPTNPSELARETLKTLAVRKIPPTPDNYVKIYSEISGIAIEENKGAETVLQSIADHLSQTPKTASVSISLKKLIAAGDWPKYLKEIETVLPKQSGEASQSWSHLIRDMLRQLETPHKGLTITRKKEGLETVLSRFATNPEALFEKLSGLMRSWSESTTTQTNLTETEPATPNVPVAATSSDRDSAAFTIKESGGDAEIVEKLAELLAQAIESILSMQPELTTESRALTQQVRSLKTRDQLATISNQMRQFWIRLEQHNDDTTKIHEGLMRLLRLLVANVGDMVEGEEWLHGQIIILQEIISKPLDRRSIGDAERNLRDAIIKQGMLRQSLIETKITLKNLMTSFINRLGEITESTGEYHKKIESYSQKISKTNDISELGHLLKDIMQDTRIIQSSALRSHEELLNSQKQVQEAENKIKQLEDELAQVSEKVIEDQLTGVLNRRGLDEAFEREASRTDRNQSPMCVVLLDIDDFKNLNDSIGHQAGDQALIHLSNIIKESLRPTDSVARYGGEEFVILLPDVDLKDAMAMMERLQRDLTKKFFLHNNERVLVTFSAGIAMRSHGETEVNVLSRADKAMYLAKKAGKNRVVAAD